MIQDQRPPATPAGPGGPGAAAGTGIVRNIQVVADKDNNTLLLVATPPEYSVIEAAVKKMDIPSRQVMMEVTIATVLLTDEINFGVEWLFKGGAPSGRGTGGNFTRQHAGQSRQSPSTGGTNDHRRSRSPRGSSTSSTTRTSRAACRRCCTCSTPTATPR